MVFNIGAALAIMAGIIGAQLISNKLLKLNNPGNPNGERVPKTGAGLDAGLEPKTTEDWVQAKYPTASTI